jgi:hypothetical protein
LGRMTMGSAGGFTSLPCFLFWPSEPHDAI